MGLLRSKSVERKIKDLERRVYNKKRVKNAHIQ
jgi:hypothetical protein